MAIISELNWIGLIIGALFAYALGAFWFSSAIFGSAWMKALGKTHDQFGSVLPGMILQAAYIVLFGVFLAFLYTLTSIGEFIVAVCLVAALQFSGIFCGAIFQNQNLRVPLIAGSFDVSTTFILAIFIHIL